MAPDAAVAPALARRSGGDTARAALAGLNPAATAAAPAAELLAGGGAASAPAAGADANPLATSAVRLAAGGGPAAGPAADLDAAASVAPASGGDLLAAAQYQRAEAVEGAVGAPVIGGGTAAPTAPPPGRPGHRSRAAADRSPEHRIRRSGRGLSRWPLRAANHSTCRRADRHARSRAGGRDARRDAMDVAGAVAPGVAAGIRLSSPATEDGPAIGPAAGPGRPREASGADGVARAVRLRSRRSKCPAEAPSLADSRSDLDHSPGDAIGQSDMARQATEGGLSVNLDAVEGPGGLGRRSRWTWA